MAIGVTWSEKYADQLDGFWGKLPKFVGTALATFLITLLAISINGEWINIAIHAGKQFGFFNKSESQETNVNYTQTMESLHLQNVGTFVLSAAGVSYGMYFLIGGVLHWYFYVRQRDRPEEWKCQPKKWLPPELERHEIFLGSSTLLVNSVLSGILSCYIANGGYSTVYYGWTDYGWWWLFLQIPVVYIYQDYSTYWIHRIYHIPILYKNFHKLHHKYKQPTAFSVTAIHPVEAVHIQMHYVLPLFVLPVHWVPFYILQLYVYYHGIIDHSGVNFKAQWWQPWQPDAIFHDNHHQYFHVNFGFNMSIWDKIHGTYRRKDRLYTEDIYYGQGKALTEATQEELAADIDERLSENPLAYRGNKLEFQLTAEDLKMHSNGVSKKSKKSK